MRIKGLLLKQPDKSEKQPSQYGQSPPSAEYAAAGQRQEDLTTSPSGMEQYQAKIVAL
jgi:hypothetical protein